MQNRMGNRRWGIAALLAVGVIITYFDRVRSLCRINQSHQRIPLFPGGNWYPAFFVSLVLHSFANPCRRNAR